MKRGSKSKIALIIAIVLMIVSMVGASLVQSSGGRVKVTDVKWINSAGKAMTGILLVPNTATAQNPAPAIVCCHGFLNNKEMQDLNYVELARRGYVVLSCDMPSHGDSDIGSSAGDMMNSVQEAVKFLCGINYIDDKQIGVTGHSFGSFSCNFAAQADAEGHIAAVLVNSMNPIYSVGDSFANVYGSRDVGVIAGLYDEFAFNEVDADGNAMKKPDYIHSANAQSFLYFGQDPTGLEEREHDTVYTDTVDGEECFRVIYTPDITHPWSHFSRESTRDTLTFFQSSIPAPNPIDPSNLIWPLKVFFNFLGLIGMAIFIASIACVLVDTKPFQMLRAEKEPEPIVLKSGKSKAWFWISLLICALYGAFSYVPVMQLANSANFSPTLLGQSAVWGISVWAIGCALVAIICMLIGRYVINKEKNELAGCLSLKGVKICRTIELAVIVCFLTYLWVFAAKYFFHVDFRIWTLAAKPFNDTIFKISIPYMLLLCVFYITNSVAINCFNNIKIGKKWVNIVVLALANILPCAIVVMIQYFTFRSTGFLKWSDNQTHLMVVWLYPLFGMLTASAFISRSIFKKTGNPYLPGIINAIIIALMSCANTCTFK